MEMSSSELSASLPFRLGDIIGKGCYGNVYVGKQKAGTPELCAVKTLCMEEVPGAVWSLVLEEACVAMEFEHANLMPILSTHVFSSVMYRVMPLMMYRSCNLLIENQYQCGLPEAAVGMILRDVLSALDYLHGHNYIHRAIKASHILINETGAAVLTSFRFMLKMGDNDERTYSTDNFEYLNKNVNWLSPELLSQDSTGYSYNSDVYSVGITACELANGVVPYKDINPSLMLLKKLRDRRPSVWDSTYISDSQASSSQQAVPRQPVPSQCGQGDDINRQSDHESTSDDDEDITFGGANVDQMNPVYMQKLFSNDFKGFIAVTLCVDDEARISTAAALKHKFIKNYQNIQTTELLKVLNLTNPIQFRPDIHEESLADVRKSLLNKSDEIKWNFDESTDASN